MAENILQSDAAKAGEGFRRFTGNASVSLLDWAKNKLMDYALNKVEDPVEALGTATKVLDFTTGTSTSLLNDKLKEDYNKKKEQVKNITSLKQIREASKNLDEQKRKQFEKEMMEYLKKNNPEVYKAYLKENKQTINTNNLEVKPSDIEGIGVADESKIQKQVATPNANSTNVGVQPLIYQDRKLVKDPTTGTWGYESKQTGGIKGGFKDEASAKKSIDENLKEHYGVGIRNAMLNKDENKQKELESGMQKRGLTKEQVQAWLSE